MEESAQNAYTLWSGACVRPLWFQVVVFGGSEHSDLALGPQGCEMPELERSGLCDLRASASDLGNTASKTFKQLLYPSIHPPMCDRTIYIFVCLSIIALLRKALRAAKRYLRTSGRAAGAPGDGSGLFPRALLTGVFRGLCKTS